MNITILIKPMPTVLEIHRTLSILNFQRHFYDPYQINHKEAQKIKNYSCLDKKKIERHDFVLSIIKSSGGRATLPRFARD